MATIEFTYDDCEFETADGLILGGPYLSICIESDGDTFKVESVRNQGFPALGKAASPAAVHVCDFISQWVKDDVAKGSASKLRAAYEASLPDDGQSYAYPAPREHRSIWQAVA